MRNGMEYRLVALISALLVSGVGYAETTPVATDEAQIGVSATITESSCTVVNPYNDTNSVHLGKMRTADMVQPGSAGQWAAFNIELIDCPKDKNTVTLTVTGPTDENPVYYKNESDTTGTQNVAIEVTNESGEKALSNGATFDLPIDPLRQEALFTMKARMVTPKGYAQVGDVSGHIELAFSYQ